jgi:hypothetical protein
LFEPEGPGGQLFRQAGGDDVVASGDPESLVGARIGRQVELEQVDRRELIPVEAQKPVFERSIAWASSEVRPPGTF